jgi:hypothetical protein
MSTRLRPTPELEQEVVPLEHLRDTSWQAKNN